MKKKLSMMRRLTKTLGAILTAVLISTLTFGQSSTEPDAPKLQLTYEQCLDITPGVAPATIPQGSVSDKNKTVTSDGTKDVLYDNGGFVTLPGAGTNGSDYSELQTALNMASLAYGVHISYDITLADDFEVTEPWDLSSITFYAFQIGSGTTSTINEVHYRIYDGDPSAGGTVIYGDLTTNQMLSTEWTNVWRVLDSSPTEDMAIMSVVADATGCTLYPGTYWVEWQAGGTLALSSGPFAPPVTIAGETTTGNGYAYYEGEWIALTDGGTSTTQGIPFVIQGTVVSPPQNDMAVASVIAPAEDAETGMENVTIEVINYGETSQSNFDVSYTINGGTPVTETVTATVAYLESYEYTFITQADLSAIGTYEIEACVVLADDENPENDCASKTVEASVWKATALNFDGTDEYVQTTFPGVFGTNPRTIQTWIYLDAAPGGNLCISDYGTNAAGSRNTFMINASGYLAYLSGGANGGVTASTATVPIGEWVHVAFVFDGINGFLYQNGVQVGTGLLSGVSTPPAHTNLRIGQRVSGGSIPFDGMIDEFSFWSVALSQQEVADYACVGNPSQHENLGAYYKFCDGSGTTLTDFAGENDGTLINMEDEDWVDSDVCTGGYDISFVVTEVPGGVAVENALILMDGVTLYTDGNGEATFTDFLPGVYGYSISKDGYEIETGEAEVIDDDVLVEVELVISSIGESTLSKINIFPNPTSGLLNVSLQEETTCNLTVSDISGRIIGSFIINNCNEKIDLSGVQKGIYFIKLQQGSEIVTVPLIIK